MFGSHESYLEGLREKHEQRLEKLRLQNELNIESTRLENELTLEGLESESGQLEVRNKIFRLKNEVTKDDVTIKAGKGLKFWAILVTLISTCLTVAGGYNDFNKNDYVLAAFISTIVVIQFTVYLITSQETRVKQDFSRHFNKVITLKYCLLVVSIYNNYRFFEVSCNTWMSRVIVLLLCISIDLIAIFLVSLAYDQITLNTYKDNSKGLLYKFFHNLTFNFVNKINSKYLANNINYDKIVNTGDSNICIDDNVMTKYLDYIYKNKNEDNTINGYKTIGLAIGIDRNEANEIKKLLDDRKITKVVAGKKTKILVSKNKALAMLA